MRASQLLARPRVQLVGLFATVVLVIACKPQPPLETPDTAPAVAKDPAQVELEARLAYLQTRLEAARIESHVPGMAIAIVKDDELIYAHGFGVSNMDTNTPVTPETVFAIGSSTKAFTATLVGMLVDEGKMSWNDPVTRHLPDFTLQINAVNDDDDVTIRDLLAHRSGFARMGVLWAANAVTREQVLGYATKALPVAPFRKEFHYNNVTYMAAGEASAKVAGMPWEQLLQTRLLDPLGMTHTTVEFAATQADPALSLGYTWREDLDSFEPAPMRNLTAIAPAGAINSTVLDMASWLRLQLGNGEFEGQRLVSEAALAQTQTGQIQITPGMDYGMGWMLREWQGHRLVEHGGNIDGFSASVAMLPDDGLGVVLLTNVGMTPLQETGHGIVWEALLTDAYLPVHPGSGEDFSRFLGNYGIDSGMPGFDGKPFTVVVKDGKLAVDVPGQTVYTLNPPDDEDWRVFEATDEVAISFDEDADGQVIALRLHQAGMDFELLREGVTLAPEVDAAQVRPYLGHYRAEEGMTVEVLIHNGRLAVDIPGQMVFDLEPPDAQGDYHFRVKFDLFVSFKMGEGKRANEVVGMNLFQDGKPTSFVREAGKKAVITLEQLHKQRKTDKRKQALIKAGLVHFEQHVDLINAGVGGTAQVWFDLAGRLRQETNLGPVGGSMLVLYPSGGDAAASEGWAESSFEPRHQLQGLILAQTVLDHPRVMFGDWRDYYESETILRTEPGEAGDVHVIELRSGELPSTRIHVDAKTGDVLEVHAQELAAGGLRIPTTVKLSDYRTVKGLRLPFRMESSNAHTGTSVVTIDAVHTKQAEQADRFAPMP
ncbi:Beta-lactamase [Enhygromyxa salina]|uniref:Beta-lactamase n=1 Tax=Enhygromyxa salina TaxID=215803 RepID=A0A0C2D636_9BACT|nr:serine hydrolase domain-containing protein [Enhygromyxa salina]KIG17125.1 Beta-lactamase [Enhygromyxa salina]